MAPGIADLKYLAPGSNEIISAKMLWFRQMKDHSLILGTGASPDVLRHLRIVSYPDPYSQLRMDYITATREKGLVKCLTKVVLNGSRCYIKNVTSKVSINAYGEIPIHREVIFAF